MNWPGRIVVGPPVLVKGKQFAWRIAPSVHVAYKPPSAAMSRLEINADYIDLRDTA